MAGRIRIKENKTWSSLNTPRFTLSLEENVSSEKQKEQSYDVLSRLIGDSDIIIELNSTLLSLPNPRREAYALKFLQDIRALGIEYRYSKASSTASPSPLGGLFGSKSTQAHQIIAHIPNGTWQKAEMKDALSLYGASYFIPKEKHGGSEMLEDFLKMLDEEKLHYFKLAVFDIICSNRMGIFSASHTLADMKAMLRID